MGFMVDDMALEQLYPTFFGISPLIIIPSPFPELCGSLDSAQD
jgi:hypothetical protein